ncbi:hypothetical protein H0H93_016764 [Arthromyces matolae]|nr:hypothetical protein H0H93_016764 [Arthromyces matolae]
MRNTPRPNMVTQHGITSSTQLNVEEVHREYVNPHADDLEALKQDAIHATRLRVQVQRMSERILELEDHQRELEIYASQWSHPFAVTDPPDYMDTDSFTYSERLTHA